MKPAEQAKLNQGSAQPELQRLAVLGLSNHDIIKISQNEKYFKGCFMRDEKLPIKKVVLS